MKTIVFLLLGPVIVMLLCHQLVETWLKETAQEFESFVHQNEFGYVDRSGKVEIKRQYDQAGDFSENLAPVAVKGRWGFVNRSGALAIAPQFDLTDRFSDGLAAVMVGPKWGYIDKAGEIKITPQYEFAGPFRDGLAPIVRPGDQDPGCTLIDKTGKTVSVLPGFRVDPTGQPFQSATGFSDGLIPVLDAKTLQNGFVGENGKLAIKAVFDEVQSFSEGLAPAQEDGRWGFIDKSGKWVVRPQFQDARSFSEGAAMVGVDGKWCFIDRNGKQLFASTFDTAEGFSEGLAHVKIDSHSGLIDKSGRFVQDKIPCGSLHGGLAVFPYKTWANDVGLTAVRLTAIFAGRNIPAGRTITEEDLELRKIQARLVPANAQTSTRTIIGTKASHAMPENSCFIK